MATVSLSKAYPTHKGQVTSIEIREPTGHLLLEHGEPWELAYGNAGSVVEIENKEAVRAYLAACCDCGPEVLAQLNVPDYRAVKRTLRDFFVQPASVSTASLTGSSSEPAGDSTKSDP